MAQPKEKTNTVLTDYELVSLYLVSVQTFAEVASKLEIERGQVFVLGKKLFDEAIGNIKDARNKLS